MSLASGTSRGSAVRMPGTSFHRTTRRAPRGGASIVAVRSEPPRPSVIDAAVGGRADEAGHDRGDPRREQRPEAAARPPASFREVRRRAPVLAVGHDDVRGVDVHGLAPGAGDRGGEDGGRHAFPPGEQHVARARGEMPEHGNGTAEIAILAGRGIDAGEQRAAFRTAGQQRLGDVVVALQEDRRAARPASASCPAQARVAPFNSRSVTPPSAEATITSGPAWAAMSAAARWIAAASASEAPPNFQILQPSLLGCLPGSHLGHRRLRIGAGSGATATRLSTARRTAS